MSGCEVDSGAAGMKYRDQIMKKAYSIFEYILAVCLMLNCRSMWLFVKNRGVIIDALVFVVTILSIISCIALKERYKRWRVNKAVITAVILFFYLLLFAVINDYNRREFLKFMIITVFMVLYFYLCTDQRGQLPEVLYKYVAVMSAVAALSVCIWVFGSVLHVISPSGYIYTTWTGSGKARAVRNYWGIQFEPQRSDLFSMLGMIVRNTSFFTEAPMASFNFGLALLIEMLLTEKRNIRRCVILGAAIVTTFSSTGYLVMVGLVGYLWFRHKPRNKFLRFIKWVLIPCILVCTVLLAYILVMQKLGTGSGLTRADDFIVGYKAWKLSPLFGSGFENNKVYRRYLSSFRIDNVGFSNSPMQVLMHGGLYLFAVYLYAFVRGIRIPFRNREWNKMLFALAFLCMFILTIVSYQYLVILLLLFFYDGRIYAGEDAGQKSAAGPTENMKKQSDRGTANGS